MLDRSPDETDAGAVSTAVADDEDWQFDDEVSEPDVGGEKPPVPQDLAVPETPPADQITPAEAGTDAEEVFGSVDDFSSLIEEAPASDASEYVIADSVEGDLSAAPEASTEQAAAGASALEAGTRPDAPELGDPEDWNFFNDGATSDSQPPPAAAPAAPPPQNLRPERESVQRVPDTDFAEQEKATSKPAVAPSSTWVADSLAARAGSAVGWLATLSLVAFGLAHAFLLGPVGALQQPASLQIGAFSVDQLVPSWIENQYEGRILAIRGRLVNPTTQTMVQDGTILVALLDASGNAMAIPPALAALSLPEQAIRELPAGELRAAQARAVGALALSRLAAGESVAIMALFHEVPADTRAFALQSGPAWDVVSGGLATAR